MQIVQVYNRNYSLARTFTFNEDVILNPITYKTDVSNFNMALRIRT